MTLHRMVDWDGPRKFAGGRSYALKGMGAILELAVTRLAVDVLVSRGMTMVIPPVMVKDRAMIGTGFFPLGIEESYAITADDLFLVGTSERRSTRRSSPSSTRASRTASAAKRAPTARTRAGSIACTSSRRWSR
jgi:seryl-tRNA synthetase